VNKWDSSNWAVFDCQMSVFFGVKSVNYFVACFLPLNRSQCYPSSS